MGGVRELLLLLLLLLLCRRSGMQDPLNRCISLEHGQSVQVLPVVFLTNHEASSWEALGTVTHNPFRLFAQRLSLLLHHSFSVFVTRPMFSTTMQSFLWQAVQ